MNSKKVKISIITLILLLLVGISNYSFGFEVFKDDIPTYIQVAPKGGKHFHPTGFGSNVLFCIQWGGSFKASLTKAKYDYYTIDSNKYTPWTCEQDFKDVKPPWEGKLNYLKYEEAGSIDYSSHQDEAYTLATAKERGNLEAWDTAYATWASSVSDPRQAFAEAAEGNAYELFYKEIHSGKTDIFETKLKDLTNKKKVKVGVDQTEKSYMVGPFKVSYPNGQYGGKNLFDWIEDIKAVTNTGDELEVKIFLKDGTEVKLEDLGKEKTKTLNGKDFYIKFISDTATSVKVKIKFKYLEHCEAEMTRYTGKFIYWKWDAETKSGAADCPHQVACTHTQTCTHDSDNDGNADHDPCYQHSSDTVHDYKKRYKLIEETGGASQTLMAVGTTQKVYKEAELEVAGPEGIDLTIELGGRVWLDQANGKDETVNNVYDSGEALEGVEVALFEVKDGNRTGTAATVSTSIPHTHTGSPTTGGGCYRISCISCT